MNAQQIAEGLDKAKLKTSGGWMACCPAHADNNPSLSLDDSGNKVLVNCLAGCHQSDVISELRAKKLWPEVAEFEIDHPKRGKPDQSWKYHDSAGQVVGYVCRYDTATGKDVLPFFKFSEGWRWKAPAAPRPLYNLHKMTRHPHARVIITEGEKAADAAYRLFPDDVVTTWQGGCKVVSKADWTPLKGRSVLIWPDADEPGQKAADAVALIVAAHGCLIQRITPPDAVVAGWDAADALAEGWTQEQVSNLITEPAAPESIFTDICDVLDNPTEPLFVVHGMVEQCTTGALFGESTAGKSFIAVDLSCSCSTGEPWAGHEILQIGPVFYFAGEGRQGIPRRVKAWKEHHGVTIPRGRFFLPKGRIEFDEAGARLVASHVHELSQKHGNPALIVIDTLARSLPSGSDENSARDMMEFINVVDGLRDRFKCVALIVHHTGHGEDSRGRARGSSTFRAAMDFEILVDKRKKQICFTKMKDAELPLPFPFELQTVGNSAAAIYGDPTQAQGPELTRAESLAVNTLTETFERLGRRWATVEEWRTDFYRRHHADDVGTKRKAFNRARGDLVTKGALILDSDVYTLCGTNGTKAGQVPNVSGNKAGQTGHPPIKGVSCPASCPDIETAIPDFDF